MHIISRWLINAAAIMLMAYFIPGITVSGLYAALITVFILGLVNAIIRPIVTILTLPINIITLGLFSFVINALMIWLVSTIVKGFDIEGFLAALIAAVILSIISWLTNIFLKK